jgi:flagellar biosynthesis/type III secretory pathway M-ring protein FliF/YscJ
MEAAMSDLLDEYPMLIFALESFLALFLLVFIVVWTTSGKKKLARKEQQLREQAQQAQNAQQGQAPTQQPPRG